MKIFITGGAGFIGKHLVEFLAKKENDITIFDNFSNSNYESTGYLKNLNVKIVKGDIRKIEEINKAIKGNDVTIHLAAKISVDESIKNPSETFQTNVDGTKNLLIACRENFHIVNL